MAGQPNQIVMARNDPHFILLVPMHRVFVAQPAIIAIGVGDDIRSEHVVLKRAAHDPPSWRFFPAEPPAAAVTACRSLPQRPGSRESPEFHSQCRTASLPAPARPQPGGADPAGA